MKAFLYQGEVYLRCIPGKSLFRSTMVHEVVNRGDIFALNVNTQEFTIIKGTSDVVHIEAKVIAKQAPTPVKPIDSDAQQRKSAKHAAAYSSELQAIRNRLAAPRFQIGDRVRLIWWDHRSAVSVTNRLGTQDTGIYHYTLSGLGPTLYAESDMVRA